MSEGARRTGRDLDLGAVRALPASSRIQAALRERILAVAIEPGAPLSEKEIADANGVSRTPVREALLRLAEERLVDVFPQYGTFVARIRLGEVRDGLVIRDALERVTAREAARQGGAVAGAALAPLLRRQTVADREGDMAGFFAADEAFHETIAGLARHPHLWRVVRREKAQLDRCRVLTLPGAERRARVMAQHGAIADAIVARDPHAAEAAMAAHLADVLPSFEHLPDAHPGYFEAPDEAHRPSRQVARA